MKSNEWICNCWTPSSLLKLLILDHVDMSSFVSWAEPMKEPLLVRNLDVMFQK